MQNEDETGRAANRIKGSPKESDKMFKLPETVENKYRFVTLASKRAEQLQFGALPRVSDTTRKTTVIAQEEVATGLVTAWTPESEETGDSATGIEEEEE